MRNKRGAEKYFIFISLILGLMVLTISLFWIFQEFFTEDDVDFQACRNSIIFRSNHLEVSEGGLTLASFKDDFPLKCKTNVVEIKGSEVEEAPEIIANEMARCWALFNNGDKAPFPEPRLLEGDGTSYSVCVPCSRITLSPEAIDSLGEGGYIDLGEGFNANMRNDYNYFEYLNNSGELFSAFVGGPGRFERNSPNFRIEPSVDAGLGVEGFIDVNVEAIQNRRTGAAYDFLISDVYLPRLMNVENGDLIISYGNTMISGDNQFGNHVPYLFYFQTDQETEPFSEARKSFLGTTSLCETWEGIPA